LIGVKEKLHGGALVAQRKFALGLGFGCFRESEPAPFPANHIAGFESSAQAADIENIAASFLGFGDQS
jgi:hypothetical protein